MVPTAVSYDPMFPLEKKKNTLIYNLNVVVGFFRPETAITENFKYYGLSTD